MKSIRAALYYCFLIVLACNALTAQTGTDKQFTKDNLTFDYPTGWTLTDDSNGDAQQLTLARANNDVQIRVFAHRGRVSVEKLPDAKKAFIDPYVLATAKQFVAMGAKPQQGPDSTDIAGAKAEGVAITASLGGEPGAAKIYWALIGGRVVVLTYFGPDKELKQFASAWDLIRNSIKIEDPKAAPPPATAGSGPAPKPSPKP
jgi:hypothetical protein